MAATPGCSCFIQRRDLFRFMRTVMRFSGMYPLQPEHCAWSPTFQRLMPILEMCIEIFMYFCTMHVAFLFMCTLYLHSGDEEADLDFIVNCLMQMVLYSWTIAMKIYFRRVRPKTLNDLMCAFNSEYRTRSAMGFTYVTMAQAIAQSSKWFRYYVCLCFVGTIFWGLLPLVYHDRSLPLACWYPFDYKAPLVYETIYVLQFVAQLQLATAYACSSGFYMALVMLICGQYDVLYCSLKNVLATAYLNANKDMDSLMDLKALQEPIDTEAAQYHKATEHFTTPACLHHVTDFGQPQTQDNGCPTVRLALKDAFRACVVLQRYIVDLLGKIEQLYCPIWFFKFGEMTSLLCLVGFVSVKSADSSLIQMISLAQYFFLISLELLIIFYYGEMVFINSKRCGDALLRSPWHLYMHDMGMRNDVLFFLLNSQRSFQLTAGKIYALNLASAKSTVTTAFSLLTILQQIDQMNEEPL